MKMIKLIPLIITVIILSGCGQTEIREGGLVMYSTPETFNVRVIAVDYDIRRPEDDRRCYYRLVFDKINEARTTTGLESQEKTYEGKLVPNRHLLVIEKWILDEEAGKYIKLNNVEQPRPNFFYFDVPEKRIVIVSINCDKTGKAFFTTDFERIR